MSREPNALPFTWLVAPRKPDTAAATLAMREGEMDHRARLLARLGYPQARALARLQANLTWEYDGLGKPILADRLAAIVEQAYRAVRPGSERPRKRATKSR